MNSDRMEFLVMAQRCFVIAQKHYKLKQEVAVINVLSRISDLYLELQCDWYTWHIMRIYSSLLSGYRQNCQQWPPFSSLILINSCLVYLSTRLSTSSDHELFITMVAFDDKFHCIYYCTTQNGKQITIILNFEFICATFNFLCVQ